MSIKFAENKDKSIDIIFDLVASKLHSDLKS